MCRVPLAAFVVSGAAVAAVKERRQNCVRPAVVNLINFLAQEKIPRRSIYRLLRRVCDSGCLYNTNIHVNNGRPRDQDSLRIDAASAAVISSNRQTQCTSIDCRKKTVLGGGLGG